MAVSSTTGGLSITDPNQQNDYTPDIIDAQAGGTPKPKPPAANVVTNEPKIPAGILPVSDSGQTPGSAVTDPNQVAPAVDGPAPLAPQSTDPSAQMATTGGLGGSYPIAGVMVDVAGRPTPNTAAAWPQPGPAAPQLGPVATGVNAIIAQGSPLMDQARTLGLTQANSRGLLNSSMAIGAAQAEELKAATPIASQEADLANRTAVSNAANQTAMAQTAAQAASQAATVKAQNEAAAANLETQTKAAAEQATQAQAADLARQTKLAAMDAESRAALQASDNASKLDIAKMDAESKTAALAAQDRANLAAQITNLNASQQSAMAATMTNDKIPADARTAYQQGVTATTSNTLAQLQNLYGVNATGTGTAAIAPAVAAGFTPTVSPKITGLGGA